MGGILSGISGYFSRHLILGTFLPVVIFVMLGWVLVVPSLPSEWPILKPIESLDPQWKILVLSFVTIVFTGFLYNLNIPLIKLYEGYPWKELWIGKKRAGKYQRLFTIAQAQWKGLPYIEYDLFSVGDHGRAAAIHRLKDLAGSRLFSEFPGSEHLVLPTRLGNIIRSFESYSLRQYGMDAVTFWPRLVTVISKDYAGAVDEAKTSFDFMLNCSALSGLLTFMVFLTGLVYPLHFNSGTTFLLWLSEIILLFAAAHIFYLLSIGRARAWGNTIRTSFDIYRRDLLKHLGYTPMPETLEDEFKVWNSIGLQMNYGDHSSLVQPAFVSKKTFVDAKPDAARFEILRGLTARETTWVGRLASSSGDLSITIVVRNIGLFNASEVSVIDTLPLNFVYRCGSAKIFNPDLSGGDPDVLTVSGSNPYIFKLGKLARGRELVLSYKAYQEGVL